MLSTTSKRARWLIGMGYADPNTGELTLRGEQYAEERQSASMREPAYSAEDYDAGPHGWDPGPEKL